ncbi:hypothetical protein [Sporosarcina sp. FA9]|uniref:AAA family ATPase n=1 Tax=Sporosarcina sp. FA9 TaxID=3413030 RepID=UPI003F660C03
MKEIKWINMKLKNFKGAKDLTIDADGLNLIIYGDNGTYKTTVADAFHWVLFGKSSEDKERFGIKTLLDGEVIHRLNHEVELELTVNGEPLTLKRIYKENWVKKRGQLTEEQSGHETDHFVDGVPLSAGAYNKKVGELIDQKTFKLLTSPTFFNEQLTVAEKRATIIEVVGKVEQDDVIASNPALKDLPAILKGKKIEDMKAIIASKRTHIKKEVEGIQPRIDELHMSLPDKDIDVPSIEKEIAVVEKELDEHATQINNIKNGSAVVSKQQELQQIELDLKTIQNELESESIEQATKLNAKIQEEQSNIAILKRKKDDAEHRNGVLEKDIIRFDETRAALLVRWTKENERAYTHEHESGGVCPTCSQSLPVEEIEAAKEKAVASFNLTKATELEEINSSGRAIAEDKTQTLEQIEKLKATVASLEPQIDEKEKTVSKLTVEVDRLRTGIVEARQDKRYTDKVQEKTEVEKSIVTLKENAQSAVTDIEKEVVELRTKRTELNAQIAQQTNAVTAKERIAELEKQEKDLAIAFEEAEKGLYLIDLFTRSEVDLLGERINEHFKYARFKLFRVQQNGGIQDVCEVTYKGVPFSEGLNDGARINSGLDIINTLSKHYGISVPIVFDNAESVTKLIDTNSQLISLVVSEKDKQLRIEKQVIEEDGAA